MTANKFFANLVLLSSAIIFTSSVTFSATVTNIRNKNKTSEVREIFKDQEGNPTFALGTCSADTDCTPSGCSNELCASQAIDLTTTCEYSESYPSVEKFSCGCVNQKCAWFYK